VTARRIDKPTWLDDPALQHLCAALGEVRFVGGAVRDTLLGRPIGDLDLATKLPPDQVMRLLDEAGIRHIPTGLAHGTVTGLAGSRHVEITTLRRDVETDGRHAVVAFTDDWAADAARRDFTMNALYLDRDCGVWDPTGQGIADCLDGRIRFVGDPVRRIEEDRLRILRFYRFQAHYGNVPADPVARAACAAAADGLDLLSGERIRTEFLKLLAAPDPVPVLRLMAADGVLPHILGPDVSLDVLTALIPIEPNPDPIRRLAALLFASPPQMRLEAGIFGEAGHDPHPDPPRKGEGDHASFSLPLAGRVGVGVDEPHALLRSDRLKFLGVDRRRLAAMLAREPVIDLAGDAAAQRRLLHRLGAPLYLDRVLLAAAVSGRAAAVPRLVAIAAKWTPRMLPVSGQDVLALGIPQGPSIGALLARLEAWWIARDFQLDREELLDKLRQGPTADDRPSAPEPPAV
jgi:poly(A) polymerase